MSGLTKRELRAADKLRAMLPSLSKKDVVFAILPNGASVMIKGRTRMDRIIASGRSEESDVACVPVLSAEAAAGLEQVLGNDGSFSAPNQMGHA